jgi:hypothetical protein
MTTKPSSKSGAAAVLAAVVSAVFWLVKLEVSLVRRGWRGFRDRGSLNNKERWKSGAAGAAALVVPVLLIVVAATSGNSSTASTATSAAPPVVSTSVPPTPVASTPAGPAVPVPRVTTRPRATPTASTAQPSRAERLLAGGIVLPNRRLTPGAVNALVTQASIHQTICLTGYTRTIRPSSSYTTALKRDQLAAGYSYRGDLSTSDYEEDHLISLELGGSPTSVKNLWPEPYLAAEGARVKDKIENRLHDLVCSGRLSLRVAQAAIAANWWSAYQHYGGTGVPGAYDGSYGSTSSTTTSSSGTAGTSSGATAQCVDGTYSYSQHRSGTCSHHGGVERWINPPPS